MKTALTIAGSDPTGGAGIQADLKTFHALGVYGISVPAALTVQNTAGVRDIHKIPEDFFSSQLDVLLKDVHPDALKTGMLFTSNNVKTVAEKFMEYALKNLVIDPVMVSSSGVILTSDDIANSIKQDLVPIAKVITPNLNEAFALTGIEIKKENDMKHAAERIKGFGVETVIITGGHFKDKAQDILFNGEEFIMLENEMLEGEYHGTGCAFSAALTARLALGHSVKDAFISAKDFVFKAMKSSHSLGKGMKILNI